MLLGINWAKEAAGSGGNVVYGHLASGGYIFCVFYLRENWRQPTEG